MASPTVQASPAAIRHLYVLDDEASIRAVISDIAAAEGFTVAAFGAPDPLFHALAHTQPEILVLDLCLGESDAVDVMRRLQQRKYRGKVLLVSGRSEKDLRDIRDTGLRLGLAMLPNLKKPFLIDELAACLAAQPERASLAPFTRNTASLAEALEYGWVRIFYQPKFALRNRALTGAEALVRIAHPAHGLLSPNAFLPAAGDPLYEKLTAFLVRQACEDWRRFAEAGHRLRLAVKVPVSVMATSGFVSLVRHALPKDVRFPGLMLELTEDEVMRDADLVKQTGAQLKCYNVFLSLDDFGAAYSSSSRLLDLPFSEVKLDRNSVAGCAADSVKAVLCGAMIDLAHRYGALVCATGVEKDKDAAQLTSLGCDLAQGFAFARPMPAEELIHRLDGFVRPPVAEAIPLLALSA